MSIFVCLLAWLAILETVQAQTPNLAPSYGALEAGPGYSRVGKATFKSLSDKTYEIERSFDDEVVRGFGMRINDALACTFMYNDEPGLEANEAADSVHSGKRT